MWYHCKREFSNFFTTFISDAPGAVGIVLERGTESGCVGEGGRKEEKEKDGRHLRRKIALQAREVSSFGLWPV